MAVSKQSIESVVFRKFYAKLHDPIQEHLNAFALRLYSEEVISSEIRDEATQDLVPSESRANIVLGAVEVRIENSEGVFWKFLEVLEVYWKDLAAELKRECLRKSEQCDGGADPSEPVRKFAEREEVLSSYPSSIDFPNGRDLRGQFGPQQDSVNEDIAEQVPLQETGTQSTDEALNGFIKVVTKATTELCSGELKRQYEQCHGQVVDSFESDRERLEAEIEHLESENKLIESSHKLEIDHLNKSHEREKASWQEAMQSQAQQLKMSEAVRKKKEDELTELRGKYHEKLVECEDLRAQLVEKEGELSELKSRITEAEREAEATSKVPSKVRPETKKFALKEVNGMLQTFQEIRSLMYQLCEGRDEQELAHIRKQLKRKVTDLKSSARRRKSLSWP